MRTFSRKDKKNNKYSNTMIAKLCEESGYTVLDITQEGEVRVISDSLGYVYRMSFRGLLAGSTPRFKPTPHNVKQVCINKTSNKCNVCTQSAGMQYHKGTIYKYEDVPGMLYIVTLSDGVETFNKVGITKTSLQERFHRNKEYKVIESAVYHMSIADACRIEQQLLNEYKDFKYVPLKHFVGYTECVITSIPELKWRAECLMKNS